MFKNSWLKPQIICVFLSEYMSVNEQYEWLCLLNRINSVIGSGVGAGAYILTRLAVSKISSLLFCYNESLYVVISNRYLE